VPVCFHGREVEKTNMPLAEFAYNNSYQPGIYLAPYKNGCRCICPLCWDLADERSLVDPHWVHQDHDKVHDIRQNLLTT
jgi:hypothetical protein